MANFEETSLLSTTSNLTLLGEKDMEQLAFNGLLVSMNDLSMANFRLVRSKAKGGLEDCYRCSRNEKTRIWYEVTVYCDNTSGPIWICSNCSKVSPLQVVRGKAIWYALERTLKPDTGCSNYSSNHSRFVPLLPPSKEDIEQAEMRIRESTSDEVINLDAVLNQVESDFNASGRRLKENWREITKRNIPIWFSNNTRRM